MGSPQREFARPPNFFRSILYLTLCFPSLSSAAPTQDSSTSSRWPVCLASMLIFAFLCLSAIKLLFVRQRRLSDLVLPVGKRLDQSSDVSKFSVDRVCKMNENRKAGFLIGLFGSPSFEIHRQRKEAALVYSGTPKSSLSDSFSSRVLATCETEKLGVLPYPLDGVLGEEHKWWIPRRNKRPIPSMADNKPPFVPSAGTVSGSSPSGNEGMDLSPPTIGPPCLLCPSGHLEQATIRLVEHHPSSQASSPSCHNYNAEPSPRVMTPRNLTTARLKPMVDSSLLDPPREQKQDSRISLAYMMFGRPRCDTYSHLVKPDRQTHRKVSISPALSVIHEVCQYSLPELPFGSDLDFIPPFPSMTAENDSLPFSSGVVSAPLVRKADDGGKEKPRPSSLRNGDSPPTSFLPFNIAFLPDIPDISESHSTDLNRTATHNLGAHSPSEGLATQFQCLDRELSPLDPPPTVLREQPGPREPGEASAENQQNVLDFLHELAEEIKVWTRESYSSKVSDTRFQRN